MDPEADPRIWIRIKMKRNTGKKCTYCMYYVTVCMYVILLILIFRYLETTAMKSGSVSGHQTEKY